MTRSAPETHDVISSERVEDTAVYNAAGELMSDRNSGQVRYAVMEFGGFLGMGADRYPIPWGMLKYDTDKDGYVVPIDKAQIKGAPSYAEGDTPAYDGAYGRSINDHYGVPWTAR